jgi:hypothetical protein
MSFPAGWPPRVATGIRSIRVYITGTATSDFSANAYLFSAVTSANTFTPLPYVPPGQEAAAPGWAATNLGTAAGGGFPMGGGQNANDANPDPRLNPPVAGPPVPMIWSKSIKITNGGGAILYFSFDGVNVHGQVAANSLYHYFDRYEAGIALMGSTAFVIEAW